VIALIENITLSKADKILKRIEKLSENHFLPIIGSAKGTVLTNTIREYTPKRILEVGTLIGYSAILMGKDLPADAEIISIEIHRDEAELAEKNIKNAEVPPTIKILVGDAKKVIPEVKGLFDMVFIDAEKDEYFQYLQLAENKLRPGSVVVADNAGIFADQMEDFLDYVRSSGKYRSRYIPFGGDGVEVSIKL
jgi:predicted O-methyltransferase YrrM